VWGWRVVRVALATVAAYLGILTAAALASSRRAPPAARGDPTRRYSILVPAHDEAQLIATTVASLLALDYPAQLFEVHVVADNCTDDTAAIARAAGAEVHDRHDPANAGKGPALEWLLARLRRRGELGDAIVFIDADTIVDPAFLRIVDRVIDSGATVVQGHYAVRDEGDAPVVALRAAAMAARTFLRPLGRTAIGGSAGLHGNGMVFTADAIADRRWSDHLTEDMELSLDLLLAGVQVQFAAAARVEAEMPDTIAAARSQQERWERGRIELARRYVPTLVRRTVTGGSPGRVAALDAAFDVAVPPLSVVGAAASVWGALGAIRFVSTGGRRGRADLVVAASTLTVLATHIVTALLLTHAPRTTYRALLQAPRLVAWKAGLWIRVLVGPQRVRWTRTTRNR
jgi:cellulose synthase/poly-beta-1,6-N-acetylglucosamine synthase-like glycosyltransferase